MSIPSEVMLCFRETKEIIVDVTDSNKYWYPTRDRFFIRTSFREVWLLVKIVSPDHVDVYQVVCRNEQTKKDTYRLACSFTGLSNVFIPQPSKLYLGANILLEKRQPDGTLLYTFIHLDISQFSTNIPIAEFYAMIGNGAYIYAHAFDEQGRCYLLWGNVLLNSVPDCHLNNPSQYWVDESHMNFTMRVGSEQEKFGVIVDPKDDAKKFLKYQVEDSLYKMRRKRTEEIERSYGITRTDNEDDGSYTTNIPDSVRDQYWLSLDSLEKELEQVDVSTLPKSDIFLPPPDESKGDQKNGTNDGTNDDRYLKLLKFIFLFQIQLEMVQIFQTRLKVSSLELGIAIILKKISFKKKDENVDYQFKEGYRTQQFVLT